MLSSAMIAPFRCEVAPARGSSPQDLHSQGANKIPEIIEYFGVQIASGLSAIIPDFLTA